MRRLLPIGLLSLAAIAGGGSDNDTASAGSGEPRRVAVRVDVNRPIRRIWPRATRWSVCVRAGDCADSTPRHRRIRYTIELHSSGNAELVLYVLRGRHILYEAGGTLPVVAESVHARLDRGRKRLVAVR